MRNKYISSEEYQNGKIVTFNTLHPKLTGVELPLHCAYPVCLRSVTGVPLQYVISYKEPNPAEDNVSMTRHAYYVTKETYDAIVEAKKNEQV